MTGCSVLLASTLILTMLAGKSPALRAVLVASLCSLFAAAYVVRSCVLCVLLLHHIFSTFETLNIPQKQTQVFGPPDCPRDSGQ